MKIISVIFSVYNRAHLLQKALISLSQQSFLPDEVIISDDGSQEDIIATIQKLIVQLRVQVRYVRQEDKGFRLAKCRNNGVRISQGDFLIFLDQDLVFTRNFIKTMVENQGPNRFCVAYPVRLTENQTQLLDDARIVSSDFSSVIGSHQIQKVRQQYRKDRWYSLLKRFHLRETGPKLRGGVAGINRADYVRVNGYDENYRGWGNEDDDLGRRFYQAGIQGINPFYHEFPLHLFHEPFHVNGKRINQEYYHQQLKEIKRGNYRCQLGFDNPLGDEKIIHFDLN